MYVGRVLETVTLLQRCLRSKRNNTIVVLHVHVYLYLHVNFGLHERVVINRNLDFVPVNHINNLHRINVRQIIQSVNINFNTHFQIIVVIFERMKDVCKFKFKCE
jgi:hypothetical protein